MKNTIKRIQSALAAAYRAFVKTMGGGGSGPIKPQ